ncbi:Hypothetical predicted protein [Paramuricea clavata]|nr:Hypothetical predicted protein [Paramuricea clavata]
MISLSDAVRLESSNPAVNTLKPWWEVWIDYTLNAFLLVVLFALAGVTISGTPGLVCLPANTNLTSLNYAANFYANAKCTTHVDGHILVVFPYIIFAQWAILFTLHLSWFNLPSVKAFLASSFDTFQILKKEGNPAIQAKKKSNKHLEMRETSTKPNNRSNSLPNSQDDGDDDDPLKLGRNARLVYLVDLLQYLSQFRYNLVNLYTMKSVATCVLTALLSAGLISWLVAFQWRTTFTCDLQGSLPPPFDHNSCSFPAAPYVYSIMILNTIFTIVLGMFNLRALFWLAKFRYKYRNYQHRKWHCNHPLHGKPGFYDYFFCIQLLKINNAEGDVVFKTMEEAFEIFQSKLPEEKNQVVSESSMIIPETPNHYKNQFVLTEVLRELGMSTKRSSRDDLWAALANSLDQNKPPLSSKKLLPCIHEVSRRVVAELLEKHALFKDLINKDDRCPMFEDYIEDLKLDKVREKGIKEDHYILMAFAIAYKANIVIVRAEKSSLLYEPEKPEENQSVWFITFIPPHYYYATTTDPNASPEESAGLKFLTDQIYQTELLKEVNDRWESKGFMEYKSNLESIFLKSYTTSLQLTSEMSQCLTWTGKMKV